MTGGTTILLSEAAINGAVLAAERRSRGKGRGVYGANTDARNLVGALGEEAAYDWAQARFDQVKPNYRYRTLDLVAPDLTIDTLGVEVKSWRAHSWVGLGRSVAVRQLRAIVDHADVLLFCVLPDEPAVPSRIEIAGWVSVDDFVRQAAARYVGRTPQLQVAGSALATPWSLADAMAGIRRATLPTSGTCAEGHRTYAGHCWSCLAGSQPWVMTAEGGNARTFHVAPFERLVEAHIQQPLSGVFRDRLIGDVVDTHRPCSYCFRATTGLA